MAFSASNNIEEMHFPIVSELSFIGQSGKAYYWNSIPDFIQDKSESIIKRLVDHAFEVNKKQTDAWMNQISELQNRLKKSQVEGDIIFEYDIVRLGKRIDVVLLIRHMVFSLEFKNGMKTFTTADKQQAEDYALDIKNFHKESEDLYVCPILIATEVKTVEEQSIDAYPDKQIKLQKENKDTFVSKIFSISEKYGDEEKIDLVKWLNSPYHPTPTIIAAAVEAYNTHNLSEIANSKAGQEDINRCETEIFNIIKYAEQNNKKCICFITGVPGAGKTLVGLDIVTNSLNEKRAYSTYITGNRPLVLVLREALKRSVKRKKEERNQKIDEKTKKSIDMLIQESLYFKKETCSNDKPPVEKILIFDEAQRVWNKEKMIRKHKDDGICVSEPHFMYEVMNRHSDWAVIICLVGLGQDIHDGEVGIEEWFRCGIEDFPDWELFYSPKLFDNIDVTGIGYNEITSWKHSHPTEGLHLNVPIRTFKSEKQSKFVDYILQNQPEKARENITEMSDQYPIYITRNIKEAKKWAKKQVRGSQRCGVMASSGAQRLRPEGIFVPKDIDVENWFLADPDDLRSSNMMEIVASEFKVQGLEIDWGVICWDADLRRKNNGWDYYSFRGNGWQKRHRTEQQRYLVNSYRVLLTRSRQGMVIFVPAGVDKEEDETRNKQFYDEIYDYLTKCGIQQLPQT